MVTSGRKLRRGMPVKARHGGVRRIVGGLLGRSEADSNLDDELALGFGA